MSLKVITIKETNGIPKGSVLQDCKELVVRNKKFWKGLWSSPFGSYNEIVSQENCEIYDEEKHNSIRFLLKE